MLQWLYNQLRFNKNFISQQTDIPESHMNKKMM